jgi:hypothetical protein
VIQARIEAQDAVAGTVVESRILEHPAPPDADELHIDLDALPRVLAFEEFELAWPPLAGTLERREAELAHHMQDGGL